MVRDDWAPASLLFSMLRRGHRGGDARPGLSRSGEGGTGEGISLQVNVALSRSLRDGCNWCHSR